MSDINQQIVLLDDVITLILEWVTMRTLMYFKSTCKKYYIPASGYTQLEDICKHSSFSDLVLYQQSDEFANMTKDDLEIMCVNWMRECIESYDPRFCDAINWVLLQRAPLSHASYQDLYTATSICMYYDVRQIEMLPPAGEDYNIGLLIASNCCHDVNRAWEYCELRDRSSQYVISVDVEISFLMLIEYDDVELLDQWRDMMVVKHKRHLTRLIWRVAVIRDAVNILNSLSDAEIAAPTTRNEFTIDWDFYNVIRVAKLTSQDVHIEPLLHKMYWLMLTGRDTNHPDLPVMLDDDMAEVASSCTDDDLVRLYRLSWSYTNVTQWELAILRTQQHRRVGDACIPREILMHRAEVVLRSMYIQRINKDKCIDIMDTIRSLIGDTDCRVAGKRARESKEYPLPTNYHIYMMTSLPSELVSFNAYLKRYLPHRDIF